MTSLSVRGDCSELPAWPFYLLFAGFPLWWVLGFAAFAVPACAALMLVMLARYRGARMPASFAIWLLFVCWTVVAAIQLGGTKMIGFSLRFGNMAGCAVIFLYLFNARRSLTARRVLLALAAYFAFAVFGGYLGVLFPHGSVTTIAERILPSSISRNEFAHSLVHPTFAEVQQPYGSPRAFYRPSAPFPYTNSWGCNVALLVPLCLAAIAQAEKRWVKTTLVAILAAGIVPALESLNRGLYIGLGVAVLYVAIALAARGRAAPLGGVLAGAGVVYVIARAAGLVAHLQERLAYSQTNTGRSEIYRESFEGALRSPLFGQGAPRASQTVDVAVGTQGQIWNVMFSYGFVALALFVGWFALAAWTARRLTGPGGVWIGACLTVAVVSFAYYGYDGPQLAVAMTATALAMRSPDSPSTETSAARVDERVRGPV